MNVDFRVPSLTAALSSGVAAIATGAAAVASSDDFYSKLLGGAAGLMATGLFFFVRKWINDREEADKRLADTIRLHTRQQALFNDKVTKFMIAVTSHLGLHDVDSDPAMLISQAMRRGTDRRVAERREAEKEKKGNGGDE